MNMTDTNNIEEQNKPSDARIILGPLVKYAVMGFVLVSIIITTVVMLDRQFNTIDHEVAELKAQLAQANKDTVVETDAETAAGSQAKVLSSVEAEAVQQERASAEIAEANVAEKPAATPVVENSVDVTPAVAQAAVQEPETEVMLTESTRVENAVIEDTAVAAAVTDKPNRQPEVFDKSFDEFIAERNHYLEQRERVYLEEFKASQARQLQFMRERLARQERRIQEMEKRNQEIYDYRAADVKEMRQMRESFPPDRI
jgi:hypothetical protein